MSVDTYDFGPVLTGIYAAMPPGYKFTFENKAELPGLISKIFPHEHLCAYTAMFLEGDFSEQTAYRRQRNHPPTKKPGERLIKRYNDGYRNPTLGPDLSEEQQMVLSGRRLKTEYLLSQQQTYEAIGVMEQSELLQDTFATLQAVVVGYMNELVAAHQKQTQDLAPEQRNTISVFLGLIQGLSGNFAMLHDLMPVVAYSLAKDGWTPGQELGERDYARGAATSFSSAVQAFHSTEWEPQDMEARTTYCPFTKTLSKWLTCVPERQPDGHILIKDVTRPGALLAFMSATIKLRYDESSKPIESVALTL